MIFSGKGSFKADEASRKSGTVRQRGLILLLALMMGAGIAALGARTIANVSLVESEGRVDLLNGMVRNLIQVMGYQYSLYRALENKGEIRGLLDPIAKDKYQLTTQDIESYYKQDDTLNLHKIRQSLFYRMNNIPDSSIDTTDVSGCKEADITDGVECRKIYAAVSLNDPADPAAADEIAELAELGYIKAERLDMLGLLEDSVTLADLGYNSDGAALGTLIPAISGMTFSCDNDPCWDMTIDPDIDSTEEEDESLEIHFWMDIGSSSDLKALIQRLRSSELSLRLSVCPVSRTELESSAVAVKRMDKKPEKAFQLRCSSKSLEQNINSAAIARQYQLPQSSEQTVLLARYRLHVHNKGFKIQPGQHIFLPPNMFLENLSSLSAQYVGSAWIRPYEAKARLIRFGSADTVGYDPYNLNPNDLSEELSATIKIARYLPSSDKDGPEASRFQAERFQAGGAFLCYNYSGYREFGQDMAFPRACALGDTSQNSPELNSNRPLYNRINHLANQGHQVSQPALVYEYTMKPLGMRIQAAKKTVVQNGNESYPSVPEYSGFFAPNAPGLYVGDEHLGSEVNLDPTVAASDMNLRSRVKKDFDRQATIPDEGRLYTPHMAFGSYTDSTLKIKDSSTYSLAPNIARGSIIAKWMRIDRFLGEIHLVANVGPKKIAPSDPDYDPDNRYKLRNSWTTTDREDGPGGLCNKNTDKAAYPCPRLTLREGTFMFSENINHTGNAGIVQTVPGEGSFWPEISRGEVAALQAIKPYTYLNTELKHDRSSIGLLAQEVQSYYPEAVVEYDGKLSLRYYGLLPALYTHLKQQDNMHRQQMKHLREQLVRLKLMATNQQSDKRAGG